MTERYPTDAELNSLSGTTDTEQDVLFVAAGESPYYTSFYKMLYRLLDVSRRAGDLRVYQDGDLTFGVRPGEYHNGDALVSYAGSQTNALTNNAGNYIYLTSDGTLTCNTTGFPTPSLAPHIPLAVVTTSAGAFNPIDGDLVDKRGLSLYGLVGGAKSDSKIIVERGVTAAGSGDNLVAAYAAASALTPGGAALSVTNRACVLIPPGDYDLSTYADGLEVDTEFVDLVGLVSANPSATRLYKQDLTTGAVVTQTTKDTRMIGFTIGHEADDGGCHGLHIVPTMLGGGVIDLGVDGDVLDLQMDIYSAVSISTDGGTTYELYHVTGLVNPPINYDSVLDRSTGVTASVKCKFWQCNEDSQYIDMRFMHGNPTSTAQHQKGWAVCGAVDIRGGWKRCYGEAWAWRVVNQGWIVAAMEDIEAGQFSITADGSTGEDGGGVIEANYSLIDGTYRRIQAGSWCIGSGSGYGCDVAADIYDSSFGSKCVAFCKTFSGSLFRCDGVENCFAAGGDFAGTAMDCTATDSSFGGRISGVGQCSGTLHRCVNTDMDGAVFYLAGATLDRCTFKMTDGDLVVLTLLDGASVIGGCTLIANGASACIADDANGTEGDGNDWNAVVFGCMMNTGLSANVNNTVTNHGNQVDANITI